MTTITFDTLKFTKTLENAGMPRQQAEAQAVAYREATAEAIDFHAEMVSTKSEVSGFKSEIRADLKELESSLSARIQLVSSTTKADLLELKADMIKWMFGGFITVIGMLVAILMKVS
jgi:hypothetical protein